MPRVRYPGGCKPCHCGCGKLCHRFMKRSGEFSSYSKYARDCPNRKQRYGRVNRRKGFAHPGAKPIGTTCVTKKSKRPYRQIKVAEFGRWPYEHRHIMEQHIGRPLRSDEHIHHINHDSLDNRIENLCIMNPEDHAREHHTLPRQRWAKNHEACTLCQRTDSKHASRGKCSRCYQRNYEVGSPPP
ncbi:MAG: HNH endonuclease signature motif containing protein [Gammaproteobacteria bacterium]